MVGRTDSALLHTFASEVSILANYYDSNCTVSGLVIKAKYYWFYADGIVYFKLLLFNVYVEYQYLTFKTRTLI